MPPILIWVTSIITKIFAFGIKTQFDHIIIGQGLAGSCLALELIKRGKKVFVLDEPIKNHASAVAAGLFNPITGKFLKQSWMAEKIFPGLFRFYQEAEVLLQQRFFYPIPIYRSFISFEEQNEWMAESEKNHIKKFIERIHTTSAFPNQAHDPFGGVITNHSGYVDTVIFMDAIRTFLKKKNAFQEISFDPEKLLVHKEKIRYQEVEASTIIFCDGMGYKKNHFFNWVPVRSLKGETVLISLAEQPEVIFNRGVYIVPTKAGNLYKVGATYNPHDESEAISAAARTELEQKLKDLIKIPYTISHQDWGIRPTTPDRKPIIGAHPEFKNLIIFNGLGTKGVSLAPYFSDLLASWLDGEVEIPFEVNIERFKSLYSKLSSAII